MVKCVNTVHCKVVLFSFIILYVYMVKCVNTVHCKVVYFLLLYYMFIWLVCKYSSFHIGSTGISMSHSIRMLC